MMVESAVNNQERIQLTSPGRTKAPKVTATPVIGLRKHEQYFNTAKARVSISGDLSLVVH